MITDNDYWGFAFQAVVIVFGKVRNNTSLIFRTRDNFLNPRQFTRDPRQFTRDTRHAPIRLSRLRVVPLSLSLSCVTRKKNVRKKWPPEILGTRILRGHFFLAVFVRVTHYGESERGTNHCLCVHNHFMTIFQVYVVWLANEMVSLRKLAFFSRPWSPVRG